MITGLNVYNIVSAVAMRRQLPLGAIHFGPMHPAEATSPNSLPVGTMTVRTSLNPFIDSCSQPNRGLNDRFGSTYPSNLGLDLSPVLKSLGSNLSSGPNGGTTNVSAMALSSKFMSMLIVVGFLANEYDKSIRSNKMLIGSTLEVLDVCVIQFYCLFYFFKQNSILPF